MLPTRFEGFIAARYLWRSQSRPEGRRFVRFITYMAIGGVAIGVCALLLALAIVRGFSEAITEKIIGFGSHVQVVRFSEEPLDDSRRLAEHIRGLPDVIDVRPVVEEFALLRRSEREIDGVVIRGMAQLPDFFNERLVAGTGTLDESAEGMSSAVIGAALARLLQIEVGDRVVAYSMRRPGEEDLLAAPLRARLKPFRVTGIYETAFANFDELYVFADIESARDLFDYTADTATRLDVVLPSLAGVDSAAARIDATLGYPHHARTAYEIFRQYFAWVRLQENIIPLVIGVIVLVGAFNIVGTLLMIMLEKTSEIGILGSMGASRSMIRRLFLFLGLLIGGAGIVAGQLLALALSVIQKRYALIPLPKEAYYMDAAPISLVAWDFLLVAALALVLCAAAAYIPAGVSARIEPIRAIRFR